MEKTLDVHPLTPADGETILALCRGNPQFYAYHPPEPTLEEIMEDMRALPPGRRPEDKHFLGFWQGETLVAVMDLVLGYPEESCAYIGFFMMNQAFQGRGLGSRLIRACLARLKASGFRRAELGVDKGNPQSRAFWEKNGFRALQRESPYLPMTRAL
ncbi:MAG: GNAT family N-acetyltransferase [Candidatus Faecousia sp.]|nr:GNAT family N-acetyltransferase [Bacillota bacterium]MDY4220313.1 GNAT family N-acetyltransferase [Candidatus Faecousia sp.]